MSTPTETEKRVLIAEACGFERQHPIEGVPVWKKPGHPLSPVEMLPDYLHSLDAISGVVINSDPLTAAKTTHELGKIADAYGVTFCECLPEWWVEAYAKAKGLW